MCFRHQVLNERIKALAVSAALACVMVSDGMAQLAQNPAAAATNAFAFDLDEVVALQCPADALGELVAQVSAQELGELRQYVDLDAHGTLVRRVLENHIRCVRAAQGFRKRRER